MLKSCIDDILCGKRIIIGVKNFIECEKPESHIYLNDFPGLSFKQAAKLANDEMQTGNEVMKQSIEQGVKLVYDDFMDFLAGKYNFNNITETRQLNNFSDTQTTLRAPLERGLVLKRWRSEMAKIYIEEIYLKVTNAVTIDIKIIDGTEITKIENVSVTPNEINTIRIGLAFSNEKIKILYDQKDSEVYTCNFTKTNGWRYAKRCCGSSNDGGFVVTGWDGTKEADNCFGMGVLAFIRCYETEVFCALIPRLYTAIWYKSVACFLKFRLYSDRINNLTTFGNEKAEEMLIEAEGLYREKYERVINNSDAFFRSIKGDCLTCNTLTNVQSHP